MKNKQFCPKCGGTKFIDYEDRIPLSNGKIISHLKCINCGKAMRKK